ncbi:NUDIX domain-containing protein [Exiguobacterium sp. Leaf196]|uniref:NUDIX hydrolase n=1 Tax=Exiguobacterium sp. Leaf196 TaxID=1736298 RepID=UPI0006F1EF07|nr:NUDIX domain-containing protein [Exiguobacterium sp. Leaf196]KQS44853.1 NUDIX hydrolase [Exiguobacterium sp. Leaf196]
MSEQEMIMTVDRAGNPLGPRPRSEVHAKGLWHETFHCFVYDPTRDVVLLQQRSEQKKDFPGMLDITAAGHLLANETVEDGVRELEEEIGLAYTFDQLIPLGVQEEEFRDATLWDCERCHVFLAQSDQALESYRLQETEVKRLIAFSIEQLDRIADVTIERIQDKTGEWFDRHQFVPHPSSYWKHVQQGIERLRNLS